MRNRLRTTIRSQPGGIVADIAGGQSASPRLAWIPHWLTVLIVGIRPTTSTPNLANLGHVMSLISRHRPDDSEVGVEGGNSELIESRASRWTASITST